MSEPFWRATRERRLINAVVPPVRARSCSTRGRSAPRCLGSDLEWRDSLGTGTVYAFSVHYRTGSPEMLDRTPYVVALVDLAEGARLMTNIVGCDPDDVGIGMDVQVTWEPLSDGRHLPLFEPSTGSDRDSVLV